MANHSREFLSATMIQRIPHLTFHTTFSQSSNPWKTSSCKTTQTHIHDPNFLTTHMNLLTLHLEALTGGFEVHSKLFFIRNSAQLQANQTLQIYFLDLNLTDLYCIRASHLIRALNLPTGIDQLCSSQGATAISLHDPGSHLILRMWVWFLFFWV